MQKKSTRHELLHKAGRERGTGRAPELRSIQGIRGAEGLGEVEDGQAAARGEVGEAGPGWWSWVKEREGEAVDIGEEEAAEVRRCRVGVFGEERRRNRSRTAVPGCGGVLLLGFVASVEKKRTETRGLGSGAGK